MLNPAEEAEIAAQFGVALPQVRRDHLISHVLAGLSLHAADRVVFFGGTALSRTFAPNGRLSEDIDLIALGPRRDVAMLIEQTLPRATRREFPGLRWEPPLTAIRDVEPAVLITPDGLTIRMQLLRAEGYPRWPTIPMALVQRYSDAPPATLTVPTVEAFAARKPSPPWPMPGSGLGRDVWLESNVTSHSFLGKQCHIASPAVTSLR